VAVVEADVLRVDVDVDVDVDVVTVATDRSDDTSALCPLVPARDVIVDPGTDS